MLKIQFMEVNIKRLFLKLLDTFDPLEHKINLLQYNLNHFTVNNTLLLQA